MEAVDPEARRSERPRAVLLRYYTNSVAHFLPDP